MMSHFRLIIDHALYYHVRLYLLKRTLLYFWLHIDSKLDTLKLQFWEIYNMAEKLTIVIFIKKASTLQRPLTVSSSKDETQEDMLESDVPWPFLFFLLN